MSDHRVTVRLSEDEAIVLMEWLFRLSERRDFNEIVSESAEHVLREVEVEGFKSSRGVRILRCRAPPGKRDFVADKVRG
jgi:hypothetical protein